MIGVAVNFGSHCVFNSNLLLVKLSASFSPYKLIVTRIIEGFRERERVDGRSLHFFHVLRVADND